MVSSPTAASKPSSAAFQSHPTDMELVNSYLRPWVESGLKAGTFIHEADVYAADPAELTRRFAPAVAQDGERAWYFFTPLRHKSVRGKRMTRTVATGEGCWHNEAKSKPVYRGFGGRRLIGHRQSFSFVTKQGSQRVRTGWLMLELRLRKEGDDAQEAPDEDDALGNLVLCKVYRSPRHPKPADSDPAAAAPASGPKGEADSGDSSPATPGEDEDEDDGEAEGDGDGSGPATPGDGGDSGPATPGDDDDSSEAPPPAAPGSRRKRKKSDDEGSGAATAAPRRPRKADREISSTAPASGPTENAADDEDPADPSAAAAPAPAGDDDPAETSTGGAERERQAFDDENPAAAAAPGSKRKADGGGAPVAAVPVTAELQCPCCGAHFGVELTPRLPSKPAAEIAKDGAAPRAPDAPQAGDHQSRPSSAKKDRPFHQFL